MEELSDSAAANFRAIENDLEQAWLLHPEVPEDVRLHLAIAVAEVVGNIIEHGGGLRRPLSITMSLTLSDHGQVTICVTDDGDELPGDVDLSARAMPDVTAEGGRGLALAQAVLEQLSYQRANAINYWTLLSRRFNPFHPPAPDTTTI